jgi:hypothetical protein
VAWQGQAVAVGGDQAQLLALGDEQDAVEVVADVVHRHREGHLVEQVLQRLLRHAEHRAEVGRMQHRGVVAAAEGLADLRQALLRELLGERHRDLARPRDERKRFFEYMSETLILK